MEVCLHILQAVVDSGNDFAADRWAEVEASSVGMYTKCLRLLRDNGLLEKKDGRYHLSRDMVYSLEKVPTKWNELVTVVEKGERILLS